MKLALYLPNFRDKVTVKELEDLTNLAEELDFDSVWTLDRIIVPEASDREELQYSFGMIEGFPTALPVSSRGEWLQGWPLIPWLAAKTSKVRIGMSITDTPYRAPGVSSLPSSPPSTNSRAGRLNVGVGAGWMPEEFAAASASHIFPKRHKRTCARRSRSCQGIWTNDLFEYHGEFADFDRSGFGAKPVQEPRPPIFFSGLRDPKRSANRIAKYNLDGLDRDPGHAARSSREWRGPIQHELARSSTSRTPWTSSSCAACTGSSSPTRSPTRPIRARAATSWSGPREQITDNLKRLKEAGLTMPLIWPPFQDVPVSKTLDDLKQLKEEILPQVNAM